MGLGLLGLLAALSVSMSALPAVLAWPSATACLAWGGWLARQHATRPACRLEWRQGRLCLLAATGEGVLADYADPTLDLRHAIAVLSASPGRGRRQRWIWWPDTLDAPLRRRLRLQAAACEEG